MGKACLCVVLTALVMTGCGGEGGVVGDATNTPGEASSSPRAAAEWDPHDHVDELEGAAAVLQQEARERWPGQYAGLWLDSGKIWIAFTSDAESKVSQLRERVPAHHDIRAVQAERSLERLSELQRRMGRDRTALQDGDPPADMPEAIRASQGRYDLSLHIKDQVVEVAVEELNVELEQAFRDYYGTESLTFTEGIGGPD